MSSQVLIVDLDPRRETFERERAEFDLRENGSLVISIEDERNKMSVTLPSEEVEQLLHFLVREMSAAAMLRSMAPHQDGPFNQAWQANLTTGKIYSKHRWNEELGKMEVEGPDGNWLAY